MNTPGHLLLGAALFARPAKSTVLAGAFAGAAAPDLSLVFLVFWASNVQGISEHIIFNEMYFSDAWQRVFSIDNSIPLWAAAFIAASYFRTDLFRAFAGAGLVHLLADLFLHHDDGRSHFWPFTAWKFESPVSYWDSSHFGREASVLLLAISVIAAAFLWRRFRGRVPRIIFILLLTMEAFVGISWIRYF